MIKRISKVKTKNISCERTLNFDQGKMFSKKYKPMIVWLWLIYKFILKFCCLRLFCQFIQTKRGYPTSFDKICILTSKLFAISNQNFSLWIKILGKSFFPKYFISVAATLRNKYKKNLLDIAKQSVIDSFEIASRK